MDKLADDDLLAGEVYPFASNTLQIVVPANNPAGVRTLKDLASLDVDVVACVGGALWVSRGEDRVSVQPHVAHGQ